MIYEETTGIQANDLIFRKLLRDRGATAQRLFTGIETTVAKQLGHVDMSMKVVGLSLQEGVARWREASNRLLPAVKNHPEGVLAAALRYLSLAVIVSNGWLMGGPALAAQDRLAAGAGAFAVRALACIGLTEY